MSYDPTIDFLGLSRLSGGSVSIERMPGLDFVVTALARAGLISLSVGQSPPTVNQPSTAWFKPALPSWTAEGTLYLWNENANAYEPANAEGWASLFAGASGYQFQSAAASAVTVLDGTSLIAIQRAGPTATTLTLPLIGSRHGSQALQIVDWSTSVVDHQITLQPTGGATVMKQGHWTLFSSDVQLAGITLQPSPELNGWVIAP